MTTMQFLCSLCLLVATRIVTSYPQMDSVGIGLNIGIITKDDPLGTSTEPSSTTPESEEEQNDNLEADCCCISDNNSCQPVNKIALKIFNTQQEENSRMVDTSGCPPGHSQCCLPDIVRVAKQNETCVQPERWVQQCPDSAEGSGASGVENVEVDGGGKLCGTRNFEEGEFLRHGEASVGEFPWSCVLLNQDDEFLGTCAIIPRGGDNGDTGGTDKVITAAHKLKLGKYDELKVRVGYYERNVSSGESHIPSREYTVIKFKKHPEFDEERFTNNIAILQTQTDIDMTSDFVNTVCLPSCSNQFDFTFQNGTGSRCWVMGWGDADHSKTPQKVQRKVDVPLVPSSQCNQAIVDTIQGGDKYAIHSSEMCAGGEEGKDACTGDGGSPLVCQGESGRWTVVGLVSWGVGQCGRPGLPGVYVNIAHFKHWIQSTLNNNF